jgi:hypothetical protein
MECTEGRPYCPGCGEPAADSAYPPSLDGSGCAWWCLDCLNDRVRFARLGLALA